jgi:hypothetical protein
MRVPWRAIVALLLAIGLSTSGATAVVACSCAEGSPEAHLAGADVVVEGVVVATDDPFAWLPMMSSADPIGYRVAVERVLKGEVGAELTVRSARSGASCGAELAVGQRWRLYAHEADGGLWVSLCSGNELLGPTAEPGGEGAGHGAPPAVGWLILLPAAFAGVVAALVLAAARYLGRG